MDILIFPSSRVSIRTPSIDVIVFLFDTVPIAGVRTFIKLDLSTVNFIFRPFFVLPSSEREKVIYILVGEFVVGNIENVENIHKNAFN